MGRESYRVRFEGGNDALLAGIVDRPDDHQRCPVAVFSHCFTCNKDLKSIVRISRSLAERGIAVLRYDMTGLGGSEGDFSQTNFTTNLADLKAAIHFAGKEIGPVTALIGHSFGGAASLAMTGMADELTSSLRCLVSLAAPSDTSHLADLLMHMNPKIVSLGEGEVTIGGITWKIREQMLDDFRRHSLPDLITQVSVPTLVLHSEADETVSFDHALRIMSLINTSESTTQPLCSLVSLLDADHLLARNANDIEFVSRLAGAMIHRYWS